jgi:hypothetical protein
MRAQPQQLEALLTDLPDLLFKVEHSRLMPNIAITGQQTQNYNFLTCKVSRWNSQSKTIKEKNNGKNRNRNEIRPINRFMV